MAKLELPSLHVSPATIAAIQSDKFPLRRGRVQHPLSLSLSLSARSLIFNKVQIEFPT